jgi:hypothetical protein
MAGRAPPTAPPVALSLTEAAATGAPADGALDLAPGDRLVAAYDVTLCSAASALGGRCV